MAERVKNKKLDPRRYNMILCPQCKGKGKLLDQDEKVFVCSRCGGFGLVKKENNLSD